jgi:hypothetical protein
VGEALLFVGGHLPWACGSQMVGCHHPQVVMVMVNGNGGVVIMGSQGHGYSSLRKLTINVAQVRHISCLVVVPFVGHHHHCSSLYRCCCHCRQHHCSWASLPSM